jgi:hypothetical protein
VGGTLVLVNPYAGTTEYRAFPGDVPPPYWEQAVYVGGPIVLIEDPPLPSAPSPLWKRRHFQLDRVERNPNRPKEWTATYFAVQGLR